MPDPWQLHPVPPRLHHPSPPGLAGVPLTSKKYCSSRTTWSCDLRNSLPSTSTRPTTLNVFSHWTNAPLTRTTSEPLMWNSSLAPPSQHHQALIIIGAILAFFTFCLVVVVIIRTFKPCHITPATNTGPTIMVPQVVPLPRQVTPEKLPQPHPHPPSTSCSLILLPNNNFPAKPLGKIFYITF